MNYRSPNQQTKTKFSREKGNNTVQTLWFDDRIPPLITLSNSKEKPNDKISIDSLNQSEVRSIYTVDKEQLDRNTLDIFNKSFKSQKAEKSQRIIAKPTVENDNAIKNFETPILAKDFDYSTKEDERTPIAQLEEFKEYEYKNCAAVRLYQSIVSGYQEQKDGETDNFEFQWFRSKNPAELLANVLTNKSRLRLYIHYLLKEIHKNDQAKYINEIHEQDLRNYNPNLKEAYNHIICLLCKLVNRGNDSKSKQGLDVSIFENGINIDIDPKSSMIKKQNNDKIRELRHLATEQQINLQDIKKLYEDIIENYAITIQNMNNSQEMMPAPVHIPLKQSRVHLEVEQDQVDIIRKKNHTFGMKQISSRSSRQ